MTGVLTKYIAAQTSGPVSGQSGSWYPGVPLPAELATGHRIIDEEHRQLLGCMVSLRKICSDYAGFQNCHSCTDAMQKHCEGHLISLLGDLLAFIIDHFMTEEGVMRQSLLLLVDREVCDAHMEDHAAISTKVQEIVSALDHGHMVERIRELDQLLLQWINHHIALHDMSLVRWVERHKLTTA